MCVPMIPKNINRFGSLSPTGCPCHAHRRKQQNYVYHYWSFEDYIYAVGGEGERGRKCSADIAVFRTDDLRGKLRFTQEEVADAKALVRILGATGIERTEYGGNLCAVIGETAKVVIDQGLFPSLRPGQTVRLEEIVG